MNLQKLALRCFAAGGFLMVLAIWVAVPRSDDVTITDALLGTGFGLIVAAGIIAMVADQ